MSRFQIWTLESRIRYALVWGAFFAVSYGSIYVLARYPEIVAERALTHIAWAFLVSVLAQGLIGYPLAKRKLTKRPG